MESGNPDIRGEVEESRGLLKDIQLIVPFFRGYRKLEDIRAADQLLRKEVSGILQQAIDSLQNEKSSLVNQGSFDKLTMIASSMSRLQEFQGELLHAQQGSSGISPVIRLNRDSLNRLYEYDLKFLKVTQTIKQLSSIEASSDVAASLNKLSEAVIEAKTAWESRIQAVEKILLDAGRNE